MMSSENRERVPSCPYPLAVLASSRCQRLDLAEAANDAGLRGKRPANMGTQTKNKHQAVGRERVATRVSMNGLKRPPKPPGGFPELRTLTSSCTGRKTEDKPLKPTCQIIQECLVLIRSRRGSY